MSLPLQNNIALRTVLVYLTVGILWIFLSDTAVNSLPFPQAVIEELQTLKGIFYVLFTGILIYVIISSSVSTQEKFLDRVQQSEQQVNSIVQLAMDGIISIDESQSIILFNPAAERIFGYKSEEVIGRPISMLIPERLHDRHRGHVETFGRTGHSSRHMGTLETLVGVRATGEEFPLEASVSHTDFRKRKVFTVIFRDTTERMKVQRALEESEERFRLMVEGVKDYAIFHLDNAGCVISWNDGAKVMKGFSTEEIIGRHFSIFFPEVDQRRGKPDEILRSAEQQGSYEENGARIRKDGSEFTAHTVITAMFDPAGNHKGFSMIVRDVTEQLRAHRQLVDEKNFSDSLLNALPGILYFYDRTGKFLRWNQNFELVTGYAGDEIARMNPLDFFQDEEKEYLRQRIEEVFTNGESDAEANMVSKEGHATPYYFTGKKVVINGLECLVGMGIDISERVKIEAAMRESEERYRNLVDNSPMMIGVFTDGRFTYLNDAGCRAFGVSSFLDVRDRLPSDFILPEYLEKLERRIERVARGEQNPRMVYRLNGLDGVVRTVETTSIPIQWHGAQSLLFMGHDLTDQKKLEDELIESEQRLYSTMENMTDAFVSLDREWRYTFMNQAAGKIFDRDPRAMIGKHIWTEFPEGVGQPFHRAYEKAMYNAEFIMLEEYYPPYDMWFENRIYPTDEGISIFFHDITPRKKAELQLKASEQRFRETLDNLQEGCQIVDFEFRYRYLNPVAQRHNRTSVDQMIGKKMTEVFPGLEQAEFYKEIERCMTERRQHRMRIEFQFPDGYHGWFDVNVEPIPEGIFILSSEVTDTIKAEAKLSRYHEQLQALTKNLQSSIESERTRIARELHDDLGQTISALRMDISMFKKLLSRSQDQELRTAAETEISAMTAMIDEVVLSMRKIIRDLRPEALDTMGVVGGIRWLAEEFRRRMNIECVVTVENEERSVEPQSSTALFRIVQEALTNISRHANASAVVIHLSLSGENITLEIRDNGRGITEEEQEKANSFGLLGMSERLKPLNGTLSISGSPGRGTTLSVVIPRT